MTEDAPALDIRFRNIIGFLAIAGSLAAFGGLYFIEIPGRNENALMFAMGVIFGWGSSVFNSEYGASTIGRKVAEGAVKRMDRLPVAAHTPASAGAAARKVADEADHAAEEIEAGVSPRPSGDAL